MRPHPAPKQGWPVEPGSLGFEALNLVPRKLEGINLDYLRVFRSGGYDFGSEVNA